jgi:hypothetical protein
MSLKPIDIIEIIPDTELRVKIATISWLICKVLLITPGVEVFAMIQLCSGVVSYYIDERDLFSLKHMRVVEKI